MSNLALALDHIHQAMECLGEDLGTLIHTVGIDGVLTVALAQQLNALADAAQALREIAILRRTIDYKGVDKAVEQSPAARQSRIA